MLVRNSQMEALAREPDRTFETRLAQFLNRQYPDSLEMEPAELMAGIHRQVEKAQGYGMETEHDIAVYVETAYQMGEEFDTEYPAAQEALAAPDQTPEEKASCLQRWTAAMFETLREER